MNAAPWSKLISLAKRKSKARTGNPILLALRQSSKAVTPQQIPIDQDDERQKHQQTLLHNLCDQDSLTFCSLLSEVVVSAVGWNGGVECPEFF